MKSILEQRAITQQLLLGALREQDASRAAQEQTRRAGYLARTSRMLSATLDQNATYDAVLRVALPGRSAWCILEVIGSDSSLRRFAAVHPDPDKRDLTASLAHTWSSPDWARRSNGKPTDSAVVGRTARRALERAVRDLDSLEVLESIGFEWLLVVPLMIRSQPQGTLIFVSGEREPPLSSDEIALAGEIGAVCAIALDNARLYSEALDLRRAAEAANIAKSSFLATMSHELRTPLNAIGGYVELIELGLFGPITAEQRTSLARVQANQKHLLSLITDILDYARIDGGRAELHLDRVSLSEIVAQVVTMLTGIAAARGLRLIDDEASADVVAWADSDRVRQILVNVVTNGVKYSAVGSGSIRITTAVEGELAVVRVCDHGPGIAEPMLESIFQPFVQLDEGLADRHGGVGLGLTISLELAVAMKGNLTAKSTVGSGSTFTLTLPLAPSG